MRYYANMSYEWMTGIIASVVGAVIAWDVISMHKKVSSHTTEIAVLKNTATNIKKDVGEIKTDIGEIKTDIKTLLGRKK